MTGARHTALRLHRCQHRLVHPQAKCKSETRVGDKRWTVDVVQKRWVEAQEAMVRAKYSRNDNDVYCFCFTAQVRS
jgi:hypothetical protein